MAKKTTKAVVHDYSVNMSDIKFRAKTESQGRAMVAIAENDYTFLTGVAGSGKTFLAISYAVEQLLKTRFEKIILSRPAVESCESLGFLPGSASEKVSPFLIPVFDAIDKVTRSSESAKAKVRASVEIVPLAYARGRTFEKAFCILDEAQNAEPEAIEMYMTRLGPGSKMVLCGDDGQPDISKCVLAEVARAFADARMAGWVSFGERDSVRHPKIAEVIRIMSEFKRKRR